MGYYMDPSHGETISYKTSCFSFVFFKLMDYLNGPVSRWDDFIQNLLIFNYIIFIIFYDKVKNIDSKIVLKINGA